MDLFLASELVRETATLLALNETIERICVLEICPPPRRLHGEALGFIDRSCRSAKNTARGGGAKIFLTINLI